MTLHGGLTVALCLHSISDCSKLITTALFKIETQKLKNKKKMCVRYFAAKSRADVTHTHTHTQHFTFFYSVF